MSAYTIDFSNFFSFKNMSDANKWMFQDARLLITSLLSQGVSPQEIMNNVSVLDTIGSEVFGISCMLDNDGIKMFLVPDLDQTLEKDVIIKVVAGDVVSKLIYANNESTLFLNNLSKIILYNDEISVEHWDDKNKQNDVEIIFNTVLVFLVRRFKR